MTLKEIMPRFLEGEKIRRKSWSRSYWLEYNNESFFIYEKVLFGGKEVVTHKDCLTDRVFTLDDATSSDWEFATNITDDLEGRKKD